MKPTVASYSGGNQWQLDDIDGKKAVDGEKGNYWAFGCGSIGLFGDNATTKQKRCTAKIATNKTKKVHSQNSNHNSHCRFSATH